MKFGRVQGVPYLFDKSNLTLKYILHIKARHFYNHKDPPFDMNHQLMSADQRFVVNFDMKQRN